MSTRAITSVTHGKSRTLSVLLTIFPITNMLGVDRMYLGVYDAMTLAKFLVGLLVLASVEVAIPFATLFYFVDVASVLYAQAERTGGGVLFAKNVVYIGPADDVAAGYVAYGTFSVAILVVVASVFAYFVAKPFRTLLGL